VTAIFIYIRQYCALNKTKDCSFELIRYRTYTSVSGKRGMRDF